MENAGIMPDADIQIICGQGVILITAQASMSTSELREVLQSLYTANNVMEQLADAPEKALPVLTDILSSIEEGANHTDDRSENSDDR